jgi:hypothetical protein
VRASEPARIVHKIEVIHNVDGGEQMANKRLEDDMLEELQDARDHKLKVFKVRNEKGLTIEIRYTCPTCHTVGTIKLKDELP